MNSGTRRRQHGNHNAHSALESLEARQLLTAMAWDDASQLTISFAPDGTDVAGQANELFAAFSSLGSPDVWQDTLTSALDVWLSELGTSAGVLSDQGLPLGTSGNDFGDSRFGDVRVAATSMEPSVAAVAVPYNETISGTWAGDVLFNTEYEWQTLDEVFSVALHEFGHVLGLEHSTDPTSAMFAHTGNQVLMPAGDDIAALQQKFGMGRTGTVELETGDSADIQRLQDIAASSLELNQRLRASGNLTAGDVDVFEFSSPSGVRGATIELRYDGGPTPRVTLQSTKGDKIDAEVIVDRNGRLVLQSKEVEGEKKYLVQIEDTAGGATPVAYQSTVSFTSSPTKADRLTKGQLNRERPQELQQLEIFVPQLFTFSLDVTESKQRPNAAVLMSVYDTDGNRLYQLGTLSGGFVTSKTFLLKPGTYLLAFDATTTAGVRIPEMEFRLNGTSSTLPVGPGLNDPTYSPEYYAQMTAQSSSPPYVVTATVDDASYLNPPPPPPPWNYTSQLFYYLTSSDWR